MWIEVIYRPPDKDCLAFVGDRQHTTLANRRQADGWMTSRKNGAFGITNDTITHWMSLPADLLSHVLQPPLEHGVAHNLGAAVEV
jgi:hypothetical protein